MLRAAYGTVMIRSATVAVTAEQPQLQTTVLNDHTRLKQEAGLAALIALATDVTPDRQRAVRAATGELPALAAQTGAEARAKACAAGTAYAREA